MEEVAERVPLVDLLNARLWTYGQPNNWPMDDGDAQQLVKKQMVLAVILEEYRPAAQLPPAEKKVNRRTSFDFGENV